MISIWEMCYASQKGIPNVLIHLQGVLGMNKLNKRDLPRFLLYCTSIF